MILRPLRTFLIHSSLFILTSHAHSETIQLGRIVQHVEDAQRHGVCRVYILSFGEPSKPAFFGEMDAQNFGDFLVEESMTRGSWNIAFSFDICKRGSQVDDPANRS